MKINSERHFMPSTENVSAILSAYDLGLKSYTVPKSGLENTTVLATAYDLGRYALRIYRQDKKDDDAIENEIGMMRHLRAHNIPAPTVIDTKAGNVFAKVSIDGIAWRAMLMKAMPGKAPPVYTKKMVTKMATLQANMHESSQDYNAPHVTTPINKLHEQPFVDHISQINLPDVRLTAFLDRARQYTVDLTDELPHSWCHLDLDKGNLLANEAGDITGVLDFDDAAAAPYVMDLAYALWAVRYFGNEEMAKQYRTTYEQRRPLDAIETTYLPKIMLYRHYVVSSMFILHGNLDDSAVSRYLPIEQSLVARSLPN